MLQFAKTLSAEKEAELQRHIESRQSRSAIEINARNVVNTIFALSDNAHNLCISNFTGVIFL